MKCVDSTFLVDLLRGRETAVIEAAKLEEEGKIVASQISVFELLYGVHKQKHINHRRRAKQLEKLFARLILLDFDYKAASLAGKLLGELARKGKIIDVLDLLIASTILANGYNVIVSKNRKHFGRVKGLKVENY